MILGVSGSLCDGFSLEGRIFCMCESVRDAVSLCLSAGEENIEILLKKIGVASSLPSLKFLSHTGRHVIRVTARGQKEV